MKSCLHAAAAIAALSVTSAARADSAPSDLQELVVVANRTPQPLDHVGQSVTVLDTAELKARQAVVVSDLLAATPGVAVSRNGGVGGVTALSIRGAETDQTVVVIDGVKMNDPSSPGGGYNFANLLAGDIARIEVLRGAQSTLWGGQAIGGVVNIVTAEPSSPAGGSAMVEAGSLATAYARAAVGGRTARIGWRLAGDYFTTDGVSAARSGTERDGFRSSGVSGRLEAEPVQGLRIDLRAVYAANRNDADGFPPPSFSLADTPEFGRTRTLAAYSGAQFDLAGGRFRNRIAFAWTDTDRRTFDPLQARTQVTFDAVGRNQRWEYQGGLDLPRGWLATFGAETEGSTLRTSAPDAFDPDPRPSRAKARIDGIYVQAIGDAAPGVTLTLGVRHDRHDTFGDHDTGQAAVAWRVSARDLVRASWGQGFKAPTLFQLFSDFGNTGLKPETAETWDFGLQHSFEARDVTVGATWFGRRTRDQIDFFSCFGGSSPLCSVGGVPRFGFYDNIARTRAQGLELTASGQFGPVGLEGAYTWLDARNDAASSPNRDRRLPRRPERQASGSATYAWSGGAQVTAAVRYAGDSFDNASNTVRLKGYTLVDLRASAPLRPGVELYGRIENLGDVRYQTTAGFGAPGRTATLGLRAAF